MIYKIKNWETVGIWDLVISEKSLYPEANDLYHPEFVEQGGLIHFSFYRAGYLHCKRLNVNDEMNVMDIKIYGPGSALVMHYIIEPALKSSRGKLTANCQFQLGDGVHAKALAYNKLTVEDGKVIWSNIEKVESITQPEKKPIGGSNGKQG